MKPWWLFKERLTLPRSTRAICVHLLLWIASDSITYLFHVKPAALMLDPGEEMDADYIRNNRTIARTAISFVSGIFHQNNICVMKESARL